VTKTIANGDEVAESSLSEARGAGRLRAHLNVKQATHGIYLEIVVLAVIMALERKRTSDADVILSLVGAIVLAELYAYYVGAMVGSGRRLSRREFAAARATRPSASFRSYRRCCSSCLSSSASSG
jgi:hypothetical protein